MRKETEQRRDDLKEKRKYREMKEETINRIALWRTRFGRGYEQVERQATR